MRQKSLIFIDDRSGKRPRLDLETEALDMPAWMHEFRALLEDVVTIEDWTKRQLQIPSDRIPAEDVRAIREAAHTTLLADRPRSTGSTGG